MKCRKRKMWIYCAVVAAVALAPAIFGMGAARAPAGQAATAQNPNPPLFPQETPPLGPPISPKQKRDLLKYNFEQMKKDAHELATLAKSLQDEIDNSNADVLSLRVVGKAEQIEKLAKKIKAAAKGNANLAGLFPATGQAAAR